MRFSKSLLLVFNVLLMLTFISNRTFSQNKGTCAAPYATLTVYADYNDADANYTNQEQTWSPAASSTVYTYARINSGPSGSVGFDLSNESTAASSGASGCLGNTERAIKIFAVGSGCNWSNATLGTMTTGSNGSTWTNLEFSGLTPNTDYIVVTELKATSSCTMTKQYLTYYQITTPVSSSCSTCATATCAAASTTATSLSAGRTAITSTMSSYSDDYGVTLGPGESKTICFPVTVPSGSTALGFKQKWSTSPSGCASASEEPVTYQLRPASNCSATPITPTRTNGQPVTSGFNPEWDNLAAGNYIMCYTVNVSNSALCNDVTIDKVGYYNILPPCTSPTITTQPTAKVICETAGTTFTVAATGASAYQWQSSPSPYSTWTDITNGGVYSGATTTTLTITGATTSQNALQYRCVVKESTNVCPVNSNAVLLTVNAATPPTYNKASTNPTCGSSNGSITLSALSTGATVNWTNGPAVGTGQLALTNVPAGTYTVDITSPSSAGGTTTTTLFTEDFEAATPPWTIDNSNGANIFVINNAYVGGTCVSGAGNFTVPDVPNQSAAITGNVQSKYLHIKATTTTGATCTAASTNFIPNNANFDAQTSDQKVTMNSSINTTGYTNVVISFYWLARGDASGNDYGAIEYSTNGGSTWTQAGAKLYNSYANWTTSTRTDASWSNQANLKFRVRWINNASSTPDPPIAIDHIVVTGDQTTVATCGKTVTETFNLAASNSPAITPGTPVQVCEGVTSTTFTYTSTGSPDKYSIDWNAAATTAGFVDVVDATLTASPQTIALASGLTAGTYTGSLTVKNSSTGCVSAGQNISVTVINCCTPPTPSAGNDVTISCSSNSSGATIGAASVTGVTYSWSPATGLSSSTVSNPTANPTATTTYTLTAHTTSTDCSASDQIVVTVDKTAPVADAGLDGTISCTQNSSGYTIGVASVAGVTYAWSPTTNLSNSTLSNPLATPTVTTTYVLTSTNPTNGCTASDNVVVTVAGNIPTSTAGADGTISCTQNTSGYALGKASVAGETYAWTPTNDLSSSSVSNPTANPTVTTTYTVVTTNTATGCTTSDEVIVTVDIAAPTASAGSDAAICAGASTQLTGSGGVSGSWSPATGLASASNYVTNATPSATTTYILTVVASNGCTATDDVTITVNPIPPADAGSDVAICAGDQTVLNGSGGTSYIWNNATSLSASNISNPVASPTVTTTFTVTVSDNGCNATDAVVVTVNAIPVASAGADDLICEGTSKTLTASGGASYAWSNGVNVASTSVSPVVITTYTVTVTTNNCSSTDDVVIDVAPIPTVDFSSDIVDGCAPITVNFTDGTNPAPDSYLWNFGDGNTLNATNPTHAYPNPGAYDVSLTVTANGCSKTLTKPLMINVYPVPDVDFVWRPLVGDEENIKIDFVSSSTTPLQDYAWRFGDFLSTDNTAATANPSHIFSGPGTYIVRLTGETSHGCKDSISHEVLIKSKTAFYIPNAFTPDGDEVNDFFGPTLYNLEFDNFEFSVFNRWGDMIFTTNNPDEQWDGTSPKDNKPCPIGVYVWRVTYKQHEGERFSDVGIVTLKR